MIDIFLKFVLGAMIITMIAILGYAIPRDIERTEKGKAIAEQMGCDYIGSARDLNSVKFLDCNGEVKVIRVK